MPIDLNEFKRLTDKEKLAAKIEYEEKLFEKIKEYDELNDQLKDSLKFTSIKDLTPAFEYINNLKKEIAYREYVLGEIIKAMEPGAIGGGVNPDAVAGASAGSGVNIRADKRPFKVPPGAKTYEEILKEEEEEQNRKEKRRLQELLGLPKK